MASLNYTHLRAFHAVAHAGGLTRAAQRLHVAPSALSVQIQALEAHLGQRLFDREGRRLVLTEAGRIALDHADTAFAAGDELVATLRDGAVAGRRVLRVGAIATLSRNFQRDLLRPLLNRRDVEVVVRTGTMADLLARLGAHELDLVLCNQPVRRDAATPWHSHLIQEQPVSLVGRPDPDGGPFVFPDDLARVPVLLPGLDSDMRAAFDRLLALAGVRPLIQAEVDDMAMLRLLARESDGVTLVPPVVVEDDLAAGVLVERCPVPAIRERFHAITLARRFPNPLVAAVLPAAG
ncbi:LysR family transcriptional regulator [Roseospira goensis]|uniref:LysR family transcriptional activator of nhaA n=1 Tax=Roseospira goensis TaxID=391922 RepID=A0A7W6RZN2_9PROT|nr:LysR family transcriptional regulator [Roseospira goensis]MBB4286189.1 LysR family transcriptional activator of nhaA [Roseospira goensis]